MRDPGTTLARFDRPTAERETRLAVLSDLHLALSGQGTWRVGHRTEERLEATVDSLNRRELDGVLFAGDLVQSGAREEYEAFDRVVERLDAPLFAIPGNHDLTAFGSGEKLALPEFERRYTPGGLPYRERVGGVDLIALNSNASTRDEIAETYTGRVSDETLAWVEEALAAAEHPLVAVHHNLPGSRSLLFDAADRFPVSAGSPDFENADDLVDALAANGAPLVLTGHVHFPAVTATRGVREFTVPPLGPFPCAYTVLEITDRGTTATMRPVAGYEQRIEALASGLDNSRVLFAAAQLAGLPLVDDGAGRADRDGGGGPRT